MATNSFYITAGLEADDPQSSGINGYYETAGLPPDTQAATKTPDLMPFFNFGGNS